MLSKLFFSTIFFALVITAPLAAQAGKNETTIRNFWAAVDAGNFDKAYSMLSADFKAYVPVSPQPLNRDGYRQLGEGFRMGFPDISHKVLECTESGSIVAMRGLFTGTNTGSLMGNPPTGNRVEAPFLSFVTFDASGKIIRFETAFDLAGFNAQVMAGIDANSPAEANKHEALNIMEILNKHDLNAVGAAFAPGCRFNGWTPQPEDVNGYKKAMSDLLASFPDGRFIVDDVVAAGDKVVVRHHFEGTHTGVAFQGTPKSNKRAVATATVTFQMKDGKPVELWLNADFLAILMQIGALPASNQ